MSDGEFADYKAHPDAYFGKVVPAGRKIEDRYELFEWFMETHKGLPRTVLLERLSQAPNLDELKQLKNQDLLAEYCERLVAAVPNPQKK